MRTETYNVKGMHCASCSSVIEKTLKKVDGVASVEVNYGTEKAKVSFDETKTEVELFSKRVEPLGYALEVSSVKDMMVRVDDGRVDHTGHMKSKKEKQNEIARLRSKVLSAIPLAVISIFIMGWDILAEYSKVPAMAYTVKEFFHHLLPIMATYALFVVGTPYLLGLYRFLRYGKANMDTLIGIGTVTAFLYSFAVSAFEDALKPFINVDYTYYDVTIVVITFIALGKYLEAKSKLKTGDAIEKLLNLQAKTALVVRDGKEQEIAIHEVVHGDLIVIKPGARIPVDGVITESSSFIDESIISGESMPVEKNVGDTVVAGTMNTTKSFIFKATKIGAETVLAHIIKMVEDAQGSRAPIQALADKISAVFVPVVLVLAFLDLGAWLFFGIPSLGFSAALSYGLTSFVGILVIACPCALGLATPTAIIVGVGKGAKEGILIKDAATLEKLHKVTTIVLDKTGTLTKGKPELTGFHNVSTLPDGKVISLLATLESKSEHPIAHAILEYAKMKGERNLVLSDFEILKGKGVKGFIEDTLYFAGSVALMKDLGLSYDVQTIESETLKGKTPILLASKNSVIAMVLVSDPVKSEAKVAVEQLHKQGISVIMLTGDHKNTAVSIAREVGITEVIAEVLPEDKLQKIKELQKEGKIVAMVGDGVNDAPALAQADVSIAMGTGVDVAIEAAGITLLYGDISKLVKAVRLSKFTMRGIKQNLFWAFFYNVVGIPLAGGALFPLWGLLLSPVFAGLAMAFSSVSVVGNSLRLKTKKA